LINIGKTSGNPVGEEVQRAIEKQMSKGIERYGHPIDINDGHDWIQEAIEECVDMLMYLCALKLRCRRKSNVR
jgi:predicted glycoside hydrolase/deacetylase ChbG (UPF0249 family)